MFEQLLTGLKNGQREAPAAGGGNKMLPSGQMIQQHSVCVGNPIKIHILLNLNVIVKVKQFDRMV